MEKSNTKLSNSRIIPESELIINPDGSIYHINLRPEQVADNVIIVGDQQRVERVSRHFDRIDHRVHNREFVTHTGWYKDTPITVISTGIGPDNIDIVINELDAVVNIDLEKRTVKDKFRALNIIRIGTSGALQQDIPVDSFVISKYGLGLDGLMHFYQFQPDEEEKSLAQHFTEATKWNSNLAAPYMVSGSKSLIEKIGFDMISGITATAPGFYGPQGRELRLSPGNSKLNEQLTGFSYGQNRITNFEMETSALYGFGKLLGHQCCTVCAIIANRIIGQYSKDYKKTVDELIVTVLDRMAE